MLVSLAASRPATGPTFLEPHDESALAVAVQYLDVRTQDRYLASLSAKAEGLLVI